MANVIIIFVHLCWCNTVTQGVSKHVLRFGASDMCVLVCSLLTILTQESLASMACYHALQTEPGPCKLLLPLQRLFSQCVKVPLNCVGVRWGI